VTDEATLARAEVDASVVAHALAALVDAGAVVVVALGEGRAGAVAAALARKGLARHEPQLGRHAGAEDGGGVLAVLRDLELAAIFPNRA
jgi:hypothetical protein